MTLRRSHLDQNDITSSLDRPLWQMYVNAFCVTLFIHVKWALLLNMFSVTKKEEINLSGVSLSLLYFQVFLFILYEQSLMDVRGLSSNQVSVREGMGCSTFYF